MKIKAIVATATAVAATAGMAASAQATTGDHLVKRTEGAAQVTFSSLRNAPGSTEAKALRFETTGMNAKAQVRAQDIGLLGKAIGDVGRLSMKARHTGAAMMVLKLSNDGHWLFFETGMNANGGVDFGHGWYKYNFANDEAAAVYTSAGASYDNFAEAVDGEGAGRTVLKARVVQSDVDDTAWVDDIRLGGTMFSGPNVDTHVH